MSLFRGSKNATVSTGDIVATQGDIAEALSQVNTVATNIDGENTIGIVALINDEIVTLANISGDITSLESIKDDIVITADNVTKVTNFSDVYIGGSSTNPDTRADGSSLVEGDLYFNTSLSEFRAWTGSEWYAAPPNTTSNVYIDRFSGDNETTDFTVSIDPKNKDFVQVYIDGVYQQKNTYSLNNSVVSFTEAPPSGTNNIEFVVIASVSIGETDAYLINVEDAGNFYSGDDVEIVLQEVGASLNNKITETEAKTIFSASGDLSYDSSTGTFSVTVYKSSDFDNDFASKTTTDLSEGTNLYYTDSRARDAVSASGSLSYNPNTGVFSYTERTDGDIRGLFSATGDLSYSTATGELSVTTYKSPDFDSDFSGKTTSDLTEGSNLYYTDAKVESYLSGGVGVDYSSGVISIGQDVSTTSNVEFDSIETTTSGSTVNLTANTDTSVNASNRDNGLGSLYLSSASINTDNVGQILNSIGFFRTRHRKKKSFNCK